MEQTEIDSQTVSYNKGEKIVDAIIYFLFSSLFYTIVFYAIPSFYLGRIIVIPFFAGIFLSLVNGFIAYIKADKFHIHWQVLSTLIGFFAICLSAIYSSQINENTSDAPFPILTIMLGLIVAAMVFAFSFGHIKKLKWKILFFPLAAISIAILATALVMPVHKIVMARNYDFLSAKYPIEKQFSLTTFTTPDVTVPVSAPSVLGDYREDAYIIDKNYNFKKISLEKPISSYALKVSTDKKYLYGDYEDGNREIKPNKKTYESYIYEINSKKAYKLSVSPGLSRAIDVLFLKDDKFVLEFYNQYGKSFAIVDVSRQSTEYFNKQELESILNRDYKGLVSGESLKYSSFNYKNNIDSFVSEWDSKKCHGDYIYDVNRESLFAKRYIFFTDQPDQICLWTGYEDKVIFSEEDRAKAGIEEIRDLQPGLNSGEMIMQADKDNYLINKEGKISQPFNIDGKRVDRFNIYYYFN